MVIHYRHNAKPPRLSRGRAPVVTGDRRSHRGENTNAEGKTRLTPPDEPGEARPSLAIRCRTLSRFVSFFAGRPSPGENEPVRGIYIHVPFCVRKCSYCDFYSEEVSRASGGEFPDLLVRELDLFRVRFPEDSAAAADTVYFGGGTPTVLPPECLCGLLAAVRARFPLASWAEVTVEANPGTVDAEGLATLRLGGFTRISIGVQSFSPAVLRTLGRIHDAADVHRTYGLARSAGFPSVGIDLIFGVPGQTCAGWEEDLDRAISCRPCHVSAYALAPEPGTPLHAAIARGELRMPPDEEVAEMYESTRIVLSGAGLHQYEISNFARPGHESRHNTKYWKREGYAGFGPSAHGLLFPPRRAPLGLRTANPPSLDAYRSNIIAGRLPAAEDTPCTREDAWKESLLFGLRMTEGVDLARIERSLGSPPPPLGKTVDILVREMKLVRDGSRIRLPGKHLFVSNEVLASLS